MSYKILRLCLRTYCGALRDHRQIHRLSVNLNHPYKGMNPYNSKFKRLKDFFFLIIYTCKSYTFSGNFLSFSGETSHVSHVLLLEYLFYSMQTNTNIAFFELEVSIEWERGRHTYAWKAFSWDCKKAFSYIAPRNKYKRLIWKWRVGN